MITESKTEKKPKKKVSRPAKKTGKTGIHNPADSVKTQNLLHDNPAGSAAMPDGLPGEVPGRPANSAAMFSDGHEAVSRFIVEKQESDFSPEPPPDSILFEVNGLKIRRNSIYEIVGKEDHTAPKAFMDLGTSKHPDPDIKEWKNMHYNLVSNVYDTGFYTGSPCYSGMNREEVQRQVDLRNKHIRYPFEQLVGENRLEHTNLEFWDGYAVQLKMGDAFFTADVKQLFDLYLLIQSRSVIPKEFEGSPAYPGAMYCVEDKESVVDVKTRRIEQKMEAFRCFGQMKESDMDRLKYIMSWIGMDISDIDIRTAATLFHARIENSNRPDSAEEFISLCKKSHDRITYDTMSIYHTLNRMLAGNRLVKGATGYAFEGFELGANLKEAARRLIVDKDMADAKIRIIALGQIYRV
jgi:hypothetical protein